MLANLAPRCAQAGELGAYLARFWEHLGDFVCILGAILLKWAKTKKTTILHQFESFLGSGGWSWRLCWPILALCWVMLGYASAILEQLGDKLGPKSANMSQDSTQGRLDENFDGF